MLSILCSPFVDNFGFLILFWVQFYVFVFLILWCLFIFRFEFLLVFYIYTSSWNINSIVSFEVSQFCFFIPDPAGWPCARALPRHDPPHQLDTTCPSSPHYRRSLWEPENTRWRLCGRWRSDAQVSNKNTQKLRENILCRTVLKCTQP